MLLPTLFIQVECGIGEEFNIDPKMNEVLVQVFLRNSKIRIGTLREKKERGCGGKEKSFHSRGILLALKLPVFSRISKCV